MKSIMQDSKYCFLCGRNGLEDNLDEHHIFGGANRKLSEEDGLKVYLCHKRCHIFVEGAVHMNSEVSRQLKQLGQLKYEETHTRDEFVKRYGRNFL